MVLRLPRDGTTRDIKALLQNDPTGLVGYNWRTNIRLNNSAIIPSIYEWSEVGNRKGITEPSIVIQNYIIRGIETASGVTALRARMGITLSCYSKNPKACERMADGVWNALFASSDSTGTRKYISVAPSGIMNTIRKIIPVGMSDSPPRIEYDDRGQQTGWWVHVIKLEAETQQGN